MFPVDNVGFFTSNCQGVLFVSNTPERVVLFLPRFKASTWILFQVIVYHVVVKWEDIFLASWKMSILP